MSERGAFSHRPVRLLEEGREGVTPWAPELAPSCVALPTALTGGAPPKDAALKSSRWDPLGQHM